MNIKEHLETTSREVLLNENRDSGLDVQSLHMVHVGEQSKLLRSIRDELRAHSDYLRTIKAGVVFFVVIASIGLGLGIILALASLA